METKPPHTGRTFEKEIFIHVTPERVFRAPTEKAERERWFLTEATVDVRPGGALRFTPQFRIENGASPPNSRRQGRSGDRRKSHSSRSFLAHF